jgi:uncharacterized protein
MSSFNVSGEKTQGVGLRKTFHGILKDLRMKGLAVNNPDTGDVELSMQGPKPKQDKAVEYLRKALKERTGQDISVDPMSGSSKLKKIKLTPEQLDALNRKHYGAWLTSSFYAHEGKGLTDLEKFKDDLIARYQLKRSGNSLVGEVPVTAHKQLTGETYPYKWMKEKVRSDEEAAKLDPDFYKAAALTDQDVNQYINTYYKDAPDAAHGVEHIDAVRSTMKDLVKKLNYKKAPLADAAALLHDIGNKTDRKTHEIIGSELAAKDPVLAQRFNKRDLRLLVNAIRQHRASTGKPRSQLGKMLSDSDRLSSFTDEGSALRRAYAYGKKHRSHMSEKEQVLEAARHQLEKYGPEGYGRKATYYPESAARIDEMVKPTLEAYEREDIKALKALIKGKK